MQKVIDYRIYFFIDPDGRITTLGTRNQLNVYIPKTFGDILKKDKDSILFDVLVLIKTKYLRKVIYRGIKDNITNYTLKYFRTECKQLDNEHWDLNIKAFAKNYTTAYQVIIFSRFDKRRYS